MVKFARLSVQVVYLGLLVFFILLAGDFWGKFSVLESRTIIEKNWVFLILPTAVLYDFLIKHVTRKISGAEK